MSGHLDAALAYAKRGWNVFPLGEGSKMPKIPKSAGGRGLHDATTDPTMIREWWRRWPRANIGIRTGAVSGIIVLDIDARHGGFDTLACLEILHDRLPVTLTVRTPSGGEHRYFAHPGDVLPNSAGKLGPGLDVRGDGGYVVAPPSIIHGRRYCEAAQ